MHTWTTILFPSTLTTRKLKNKGQGRQETADKMAGERACGDSHYERDGDACRKFWIKPLKETDLGVAQAFFDP